VLVLSAQKGKGERIDTDIQVPDLIYLVSPFAFRRVASIVHISPVLHYYTFIRYFLQTF
jgi:hypothetical protein